MSLETVQIAFQYIALVFAISVHEAAHAWTANRCGDPTARMLGRITLNPIKHLDPIGTVVLPLIAMFGRFGFLVGWGKPTPVDPRHFKNPVWDDIKTSLAGPISNLLVAAISVVGLAIISATSPLGRALVHGIAPMTGSALVPITVLLYEFMYINVLLAAFNIIPIPPLDGSHVLRHFLPDGARRMYDMVGMFGLILLFLVGGPIISFFMRPFLQFFDFVLARI
jgi:Zn-dependent protease